MASVLIEDIWPQHVSSTSPSPADSISFDEDLSWILDGFVSRVMADGGIVTHHQGGVAPRTIAASGGVDRDGDEISELMKAAIAVADANGRRMHGPDPLVVWCGVGVNAGGGRAILIPSACGDGGQVVTTAIYRAGSPIVTQAAETMASRLHPMLGGYFRLWGKARAHARRAARLEAALNFGAAAIAVLDRSGEIKMLNTAMQRLVDAGDGLRVRGKTLVATDLAGSMRLQVAIGQAAAEQSGEGRPPRAIVVFLERPKDDGLLPIAVTAATFAPWEIEDAAVIIHAVDPNFDVARSIRPVCQAHGLSHVETNLVLRLMEGDVLADAADAIRVKEQTARAYLKQIFVKTSVTRQSDLIRLMLMNAVRVDCTVNILPG